jgi:hypothetical protein
MTTAHAQFHKKLILWKVEVAAISLSFHEHLELHFGIKI